MTSEAKRIAGLIAESHDFLVASHVNPDGDAVGSTAAFAWILEALGKRAWLYNASGLPDRFDWMRLPGPLATALPADDPDTIVVLDSATPQRVGEELHAWMQDKDVVNIDHHPGNPGFGSVNWVDPAASSVGEMVAQLAGLAGVRLDGPLAEAVYVALATDTGHFSYGNTTAGTMRLAATLIANGLDTGRVNALIDNQLSPQALHLWGRVLSGLALHHHGRMGLAVISRAMLHETGTGTDDLEGIIDLIRRLKKVEVAATLREVEPGLCKFSLRAADGTQVRPLAEHFGGGGHTKAAGGHIRAGLEEAAAMLVRAAGEIAGLDRDGN